VTALWFKRSCTLTSDPAMQSVMMEHTALAVVIFEELVALCKISRGQGRVTVAYEQLAHRLMVKPAKVKDIVMALDRVGLIVVDREETDVKALVADIPSWGKWNPRDSSGAIRQRRYRERHGDIDGDADDDNDVTDDRDGPTRYQSKRTEKEKQLKSTATQPRGISPGLDPSGKRAA
jgi:hypothetical protein